MNADAVWTASVALLIIPDNTLNMRVAFPLITALISGDTTSRLIGCFGALNLTVCSGALNSTGCFGARDLSV
eukprot:2981143-Rhodomonas_salina.1